MTQINPSQIHEALINSTFSSPDEEFSISENFNNITIENNKLSCIFYVKNQKQATLIEPFLRDHCQKIISQISTDISVNIIFTAEQKISQTPSSQKSPFNPRPIEGVKKIIGIAAGKGGVGKSTTSLNLAISLVELGYKVGIVDADIHGPSLSKLTDISALCDSEQGRIIPHEKFGIKLASIAFLTKNEGAMIWRGPMVTKALLQLFRGVNWTAPSTQKGIIPKIAGKGPQPLDFLIVDFPPGTGDIQITIAQNIKVDGIVLVSTPQEVALLDVQKAADMFSKTNVPILGCIANMAYFQESSDTQKQYIFGQNHVAPFCKRHDITYLGEVPLSPSISEASDSGLPISNKDNANIRETFLQIAKRIITSTEAQ